MEYLVILQQIVILFALAALGFLVFRLGIFNETANKSISKLVLYVTLPAMIIASVADVPPNLTGLDLLVILGISCLSYLLLGIIALLTPRLIRGAQKDYGLYEFMVLFGNVGFIGFPVVAALYGSEAVFVVALCNLPMNLLSFTLGVLMIAPRGTKLKARALLTPAVVASVAAPLLFLLPGELPAAVYEGFGLLGDATVPLAMMMIGASLAKQNFNEIGHMPQIYLTSLIKLLICPALIYFVLQFFVTNPLFLGVATVLAAMPVATNTTLFCIEYNGNEALASRTVCISTLLSAVTVPLIVFFFLI